MQSAVPPPVAAPTLLDRIQRESQILRAPVLRHGELGYLRTGMRQESLEYARAQLAGATDVTAAALAREPIVVAVYSDGKRALLDGRHRLFAAHEAGARAIRVTMRVYGPRGAVKAESTQIMQIDRAVQVTPPWHDQ